MKDGWIAVDLDGTLAHYDKWVSIEQIGEPIPKMIQCVKQWIEEGLDVRIFTARVHCPDPQIRTCIEAWCLEHIGKVLPITNVKDFGMITLYDDRCIQVEKNTGRFLG